MIKSMTAFAREELAAPWGNAIWEVRTVNFRYLDVNARLPEDFRGMETMVREKVAGRLGRGKVDCTLRYHAQANLSSQLKIDRALVEQLMTASHEIDTLLGCESTLRSLDLLRWPGVIETTPPDLDVVSSAVTALLETALDGVVAMREREGEKISALIDSRCVQVQDIAQRVSAALPEIQTAMRERIRQRLSEVSDQLDADRVETEMVVFANRMDVSEELDRLAIHVSEVQRMLGEEKSTGRRLDFLMQELNREANTLGSKSVDTQMTSASVDLKVLIEQMREQIQNIE
jgi:uncharacterized protein (TIGR00255 family)